MCQANPESSRMPLAKTKAWPSTAGTVSSGAWAGVGLEVREGPRIWRSAASVNAAVAKTQTTTTTSARGRSAPSRMFIPSAPSGGSVIPLPGEKDDGVVGRLLNGDDGEDRTARGRGVRDRVAGWLRVLPAEGDVGEALEPRKALRVGRLRVELDVQMRTGGVARHADEPDLLAGGQRDARRNAGVEDGEVAVRPGLPISRLERQADPAAWIRVLPRLGDDSIRERIDRRAHRRGDVGRRIVMVVVRDRDDRRAAADREDVVPVVRRRAQQRPRAGGEGGRDRTVFRRGKLGRGVLQRGAKIVHAGLRLGADDAGLDGALLQLEPVGEHFRGGETSPDCALVEPE